MAAAALVAVLLLVTLVLLDRSGSGGAAARPTAPAEPAADAGLSPRPDPGSSRSAPPPAGAAPATPALPAGWHLHHDPAGFTIAVPDGWAITRDGTIVYFRDPRDGRLLGVDQSPNPKWDPVADWTAQESYRVRRGDWRAYQRIRIAKVDYFLAAADWEYTYAGSRGRLHVINRGFVASAHQAHAIYWSTPESTWAANLQYFELITRTFQPIPR